MSARRRPVVAAPRLPTGRTLRAVRELEIADGGVYADMEISHCRLVDRTARNVRFEGVQLRETDLSHTRLEGVGLADARLGGCGLANATVRNTAIDPVGFI